MQHDTFHRQLFGHNAFIQALIEGFLPAEGVRFDFDTLEPYKTSFVSPGGVRRDSDCVWRVRAGENWHYLYLAIEFQSSNYRYMAARMLTYVALLIDALIGVKELNDETPALPAITPIILYNGEARWTAPVNIRDLFTPMSPVLERWLPNMQCLLIDEVRLKDHPSRNIRNLASAFFRTINPVSMEELIASVQELRELVQGNEELTRLLGQWSTTLHPDDSHYTEHVTWVWQQGADSMGARQVIDQWVEEKIQIGREQGLEQGRLEGLLVGEREILLRQLKKRFGPTATTPELNARISTGNREELERWSEKLLDSRTIEGVFAD